MRNDPFRIVRRRQIKILLFKYLIVFLSITAISASLLSVSGVINFRATEKSKLSNENTVSQEPGVEGVSIESDQPVLVPIDTVCYEVIPSGLKVSLSSTLLLAAASTTDTTTCALTISSSIIDSNNFFPLYRGTYAAVTRADSQIISVSFSQLSEGLKDGRVGGGILRLSHEAADFLSIKTSLTAQPLAFQSDELIEKTLLDNSSIAIIPISQLNPKLKVIRVDQQSPLDKNFDPANYPLTETVWIDVRLSDENNLHNELTNGIESYYGGAEYDQAKITTILLTGRSAVGARGYFRVNQDPSSFISPKLRQIVKEADFSQLNNEASVSISCGQSPQSKILCANSSAITQITESGFDIIGMNGQSVLDQGRPSFESTLSLYTETGAIHYGGGRNRADALGSGGAEINGQRVDFRGFTLIAPTRYLANDRFSGTVSADKVEGDKQLMRESLTKIPTTSFTIVDMQWGADSSRVLSNRERDYAEALVANGADIVIGTNSLTTKPMHYIENVPIFYGLGNFAYTPDSGTVGRSIMVRLYLYNNRLITYEIIPTILTGTEPVDLDMDSLDEMLNTVYRETAF